MREWKTEDKSGWGPGQWQKEPDKIQWVDKATGLDCLIVRNSYIGNLCGYVGVPEGHPAFGQHYDKVGGEEGVEVHGGLTYADNCQEPTEEEWLKIPELLADSYLTENAKLYPVGDAARRLAELEVESKLTFQEWVDYQNARRICHIPEPGRPDKVWWLGFDCAHCWDLSPGMKALLPGRASGNETYRTVAYVKKEVRKLAKQLYDLDGLNHVEV